MLGSKDCLGGEKKNLFHPCPCSPPIRIPLSFSPHIKHKDNLTPSSSLYIRFSLSHLLLLTNLRVCEGTRMRGDMTEPAHWRRRVIVGTTDFSPSPLFRSLSVSVCCSLMSHHLFPSPFMSPCPTRKRFGGILILTSMSLGVSLHLLNVFIS